MKLYEYEAKDIFKKNGLRVPDGIAVTEPAQGLAFLAARKHAVLKTQVLTGGRGKAGGILFSDNAKDFSEKTERLKKLPIKGMLPRCILVEEKLDVRQEMYMSCTISRSTAEVLFMFSLTGGVEIESVAEKNPDAVKKLPVNILDGMRAEKIEVLLAETGLEKKIAAQVRDAALALYKIFTEYRCQIAEINPLVVTVDGTVVAGDAKMEIFDEAAKLHPEYFKEDSSCTALEKRARAMDLGYVELSGNVGVIGNGAGLNMATLDIISFYGAKPANFLEVSGRTYGKAEDAVGIVVSNPNVKIVFGNFFGCISRCDVIAEGLAAAHTKGNIKVPMVIAMRGTGAKEGLATLRQAGITEIYEDDIEAGRRVADLLKEAK